MRFPELVSLYKNQLDLLIELMTRQGTARNSIEAGNINGALQSMIYDNFIIDRYESLTDKIEKLHTQICEIMKITPEDLEALLTEAKDPLIITLHNTRGAVEVRKKSVEKVRKETVALLEKKATQLKKDIGSIDGIKNIQ